MVDQAGNSEEFGLRTRLDVLERASVITPSARRATERSVATIEAFAAIALSDDLGAQLVTHVAMALTRLDRGEESPDLPAVAGAEIEGRLDEWRFARELAAGWQRDFGFVLPEGEVAYLVVHLSVLRERARLGQ